MKERLMSRAPAGFFGRLGCAPEGVGVCGGALKTVSVCAELDARAVKAGRRPPGGAALAGRSVRSGDNGCAKPARLRWMRLPRLGWARGVGTLDRFLGPSTS